MPHIGKEEVNEGNFVKYLFLQEYVFDFQNFYNVSNMNISSDDEMSKQS